jgi:hypothetical protein
MRTWRDEQLSAETGSCGTLMYPFSGPDILNAYLLFPGCRTYVLFGLEHPGTLPALDRLSPDLLSDLLAHVRQALGDLLARNYFITRHMMTEVESSDLHGNFPLMAVFLARLDLRDAYPEEAVVVLRAGPLGVNRPPHHRRSARSSRCGFP